MRYKNAILARTVTHVWYLWTTAGALSRVYQIEAYRISFPGPLFFLIVEREKGGKNRESRNEFVLLVDFRIKWMDTRKQFFLGYTCSGRLFLTLNEFPLERICSRDDGQQFSERVFDFIISYFVHQTQFKHVNRKTFTNTHLALLLYFRFNPWTPEIWLLILLFSCYTFPSKLVTRIWC